MGSMEVLLVHDDPVHWEYPPGFDYRDARVRVAAFVADLAAALGVAPRIETDSQIQDASFHTQLFLPLADGRFALIRFSNFGNMATVSDDLPVPEPTMRTLQELFSRHQYIYIPASLLAAPYPGAAPSVDDIPTWWVRYFDWL